jgi:chromosome partitioning protein
LKTLAIAMQKGGTGKTTTTVNLAAALAEIGQRVLVVDVDPQANASTWLDAVTDGKGMFATLCEKASIASIVCKSSCSGVFVAPSTSWLVGAERALAGEIGAEAILRRRLADAANDYDIALIDTPPTLGVLTVGALVAADHVLIPVEAHILALNGLAQIMETIGAVRERLNADLTIAGILACRVDSRTKHGPEVVAALRARFPAETLRTVIRENIRLAEAPSFGLPVSLYDPKSAGADDHRALAQEILQRLQGNT